MKKMNKYYIGDLALQVIYGNKAHNHWAFSKHCDEPWKKTETKFFLLNEEIKLNEITSAVFAGGFKIYGIEIGELEISYTGIGIEPVSILELVSKNLVSYGIDVLKITHIIREEIYLDEKEMKVWHSKGKDTLEKVVLTTEKNWAYRISQAQKNIIENVVKEMKKVA